jgi:hypothetical protein
LVSFDFITVLTIKNKSDHLLVYHFKTGINFEAFNASWLKHHLESEGFKNVDLRLRFKQGHLEGVFGKDREIEIDILSFKPFLIAEATTYLSKKEFPKIERFAQVNSLIY